MRTREQAKKAAKEHNESRIPPARRVEAWVCTFCGKVLEVRTENDPDFGERVRMDCPRCHARTSGRTDKKAVKA